MTVRNISLTAFGIDVAFPGADLGAKINAADASIIGVAETLLVPPGNYTINTQIILTASHALHFGAGYYTVTWPSNTDPLLLYQDNTEISGDGWNTIIEQPHSLFLFAPYSYWVTGNQNGQTNTSFHDMQIVQPNYPQPSGGPQQVIMHSNGSTSRVHNILFNNTYGIAVNFGGGAGPDPPFLHFDNGTVSDCIFRRNITDSAIACTAVNAKNFKFINNVFERGSSIDIEVNTSDDILQDWVISGNVIRDGGVLLVQDSDGSRVNNGVIENNILDGDKGDGTTAATGILINRTRGILVTGNVFSKYNFGTPQGLQINSSHYITVRGNHFQECSNVPGIGAPPPPILSSAAINLTAIEPGLSTTYCVVAGNAFMSAAGGWNAIQEEGDGTTCDHNVFFGNVFGPSMSGIGASEPFIYTTGVNSRAYDNVFNGRKVGGPGRRVRRLVSVDGNIVDTDDIVGVDTSVLPITLTLPDPAIAAVVTDSGNAAVPGPTLMFTIQDEAGAASIRNVTIAPHGAEKINGVAASIAITVNNGRATLYTDGTNWFAAV